MTIAEDHPLKLGGGLALITIALSIFLPEPITITLLGILLMAIAAVYIGFAIADGNPRAIVIESVVALLYLYGIALGLMWSAWVLVLGYFAHGLWDWVHHHDFSATTPRWYIPFCVIYDWIIAGFLAVLILT